MNRFVRSLLLCFALTVGATAWAQQQPAQPEQPERPAQAAEPAEPAAPESPAVEEPVERDSDIRINLRDRNDNVILNMWGDARLPANEIADGVISIFGDTHVEGEVWDAVVAIFGNSHVTGQVHGGVVSVFGNTYIDGEVQEAAVSVFGDLELGPNARVDGDIAVVAGKLTRDPGAVVRGQSEIVAGGFPAMEGVRLWIEKCLLYGRPLAFEPGLGWAWGIAFGFLLFYVVIALMFDRGVTRCVETLETQPGQSVVASLMTVVLVPVMFLLLVISVVGIVIVPFAGMAMVVASLFGKAVALAAIGRRITRFTGIAPFSHIAFATLVGGLIAMALYVIPVIGFIAYKLLGVIGLGVVMYTILLTVRERSANRAAVAAAAAPVGAAAPVAAAAAPFASASDAPVEPAPAQSADAFAAPVPPPAPAAITATRAGFWIRMGALMIDIVLISVIVGILDLSGETFIVALAAYGALMWKLKSTTIGGLVCGLKVVRRDGGEINWDTAIVRALGCFLSMVVAGLGFLWIVFDEDRQAWHDKIAGTLVVRTTRPESLV
jgi:uncharacterized RDD family membrane protein YckC/cytoskeletal protein CcmA (bactofilin family)